MTVKNLDKQSYVKTIKLVFLT